MSVLEVRGLTVRYGTGGHTFTAVDDVNITVCTSTIVGLVGESGSGKSTLAKAIVGLAPVSAGEISWNGEPMALSRFGRSSAVGHRLQYIFQDPYASLDPRMSIGASLAEGVEANPKISRSLRRQEIHRLLELVRLDPECISLRPRQLSGGQRQRVAIARALATDPEILIADEITSALDVSVQGAVLNLLREIQNETGVGVLFISHNLAVVRYLADSIAVMHCGRLVELADTEELIERPSNAYTKRLLEAVPSIVTDDR